MVRQRISTLKIKPIYSLGTCLANSNLGATLEIKPMRLYEKTGLLKLILSIWVFQVLIIPEQVRSEESIPIFVTTEEDTTEDNARMNIGGSFMMDAAAYDSDLTDLGSGTKIRRARLYVAGTLPDSWKYKLQYDFTGTGNSGIKSAYLQHKSLKLGYFKEPFSLQNMSSSKNITFTERSLTDVFSPGRHIGLTYSTGGSAWTMTGGVFGQGVESPESEKDEGYGISGRATYALLNKENQKLHFGLGVSQRYMGEDESIRFRERPESDITDTHLVDTDKFDAKSLNRRGFEALWVQGSLALQGEYVSVNIDRDSSDNTDVNFNGYYIEASWFLTGESVAYNAKKGNISKLKPISPSGAWQTALRFSRLDLTDEDIIGGEEDNLTFALNWYPIANLRFMANYIQVLDVEGGPHADDKPAALVLRAQVAF